MADYDKYYEDGYDPQKENEEFQKRLKLVYIMRELNSNPSSMSNIKALMDYRDLRTEQAWLSYIINEMKHEPNSSEFKIDSCRMRVEALDKRRRETHNKALGNYAGLLRQMKIHGIPPIYTGHIMDPSKTSNNYGDPNIRNEMTESFLELLYIIEDAKIEDLRKIAEEQEISVQDLSQVKKKLEKSTHDWGVKEPLRKDDDGNIEFM